MADNKKRILQQAFLFDEITNNEDTKLTIRARESNFRVGVELQTELPIQPNYPPLVLPVRWEILVAETTKRNIPLRPLITPVQESITDVEREIRRISETGMGRLLVLSGVSGSGKTTFLNSLKLFIESIEIFNVEMSSLDRRDSVENALAAQNRKNYVTSIVVLEGRETPGSLKDDEIDVLLTTLNRDFRSGVGRKTLFVIPTTSNSVAHAISNRAATIGGMTSGERPFYIFNGPPRVQYISITNDTLRVLNESLTLLDYGVSDDIARGLAESAASIGSFMSSCYDEINNKRDTLRTFANSLKRKRIHLWMVFCSTEENARRNHDIIRSLTTGNFQHVQVQRMLVGDSQEARYWESKEALFARAAQYLDLRIMYLPIRTTNAIITAYGHKELLDSLKEKALVSRAATRASAQESLKSTALGAFLFRNEGFVNADPSKRGKITDEQKDIFLDIVSHASKDDKILHAAVAETLRDIINDPDTTVITELALNERGGLVADIGVVTSTDIFCLELKWRSSVLSDGEVIRQTAGRVKEFVTELPELRSILSGLSQS